MPHGAPKKFTAFRIEPELLAAVKERTSNVTQAVEEGLRCWLAREKRRRGKGNPLTKHLAPTTAREIAARNRPRSVQVRHG